MDGTQKRKITTAIVVILLSPILFLLICALILFLAPGVKIFGVRFVANGTSVCEKDEQIVSALGFHGDIYINTTDVPVTINYIPYQTFTVRFHQVFNGLTKSDVRVADLEWEIDSDGDLRINTTELTTWVYSNRSDENYFFQLDVPSSYQSHGLYINAHASPVTINGAATYSTLSVVTASSLKITDNVRTTNFVYHTSKAIELNEEKLVCTNADLASTSSAITVKYALSGNLEAQTNSGDIKFVSCNNLTARTSSGNVQGYGPGYPSVFKSVDINSKRGSVTLGVIGQNDPDALAEIKTNGSVYITKMVDGKISTERGNISIGWVRTAIINGKLGNINIGAVESQLVVHGQNGNVVLGEDGSVNNVWVETTTGKITAYNTMGTVYLHSNSNNITVDNFSSRNLTLLAGGKLNATNLMGEVKAEANRAVYMKFAEVSGNVTLITHNKCKKVEIDATCASQDSVGYYLSSSKGKKQRVYVGEDLITDKSLVENLKDDKFNFDVRGTYAEVTLKLSV